MPRPVPLKDGRLLCAFSGAVLVLLILANVGRDYPLVGHDHRYYLPRLLDTDLHLRLNGLIVQWYTPSFGGGLPAFPNPQHLQHSILQLFTFLMTPWAAVLAATALYALVGLYVFYRYLRTRLELTGDAAVLGAVFLIGNGFFIEHMIVGHVGFQVFPLAAVLLTALTDLRRGVAANASLVALTLAVMVYQAGIYLIVLLALSLALTLPVLVLIDPRLVAPRRVVAIALAGAALAAALVAPKVHAVLAFMQHFPREVADVYPIGTMQALAGLAAQLVGGMVLVPLVALSGRDPALVSAGYSWVTGASVQVGMWELDTGLSPVLVVGLAAAALRAASPSRVRALATLDAARFAALGLVLAVTWVLVEATLARGAVYPMVKELPILRSMHVNHRIAATFILPLSIVGALTFDRWAATRRRHWLRLAIAIAVASPAAYMLLPPAVHLRTFDVRPLNDLSRAIRDGRTPAVETIADAPDAEAFAMGASSYRPYEPLFGYGLEAFAADTRPGSIRDVRDGAFNMTHPASLVFPELNGLRLFERIAERDRAALDAFASRRQPQWRTPAVQTWLNAAAFLALAFCLVILARARRAGSRAHPHVQPMPEATHG
jgi:hypothetical protein